MLDGAVKVGVAEIAVVESVVVSDDVNDDTDDVDDVNDDDEDNADNDKGDGVDDVNGGGLLEEAGRGFV